MKNILYTIILSLLFSFSVFANFEVTEDIYAGSADGKGLLCEIPNRQKKYIWFDNGRAIEYMVHGYKVEKRMHFYGELGTNIIAWNYWRLDRQTLELSMRSIIYQCKIILQKKEILDYYNNIIEQSKKNNKI